MNSMCCDLEGEQSRQVFMDSCTKGPVTQTAESGEWKVDGDQRNVVTEQVKRDEDDWIGREALSHREICKWEVP